MKIKMDSTALTRYLYWGKKGIYGILDQSLFSGANFIVTLLLARWLPVKDFGYFSIAYASYNIYYQLHNSIVTEPMSVLGPAKTCINLPSYVIKHLWLHIVVTGVMCLLTILFSIAFIMISGDRLLGNYFLLLGILIPCMLLPWYVRRAHYLLAKPQNAAITSLIYLLCIFVMVCFAYSTTNLDGMLGLVIIGISGLLSGVVGIGLLHTPIQKILWKEILGVFLENIHYGYWLILSGLLLAIANQGVTYISSGLLGVEAAGAIRVLTNFQQPMSVIIGSIGFLALPRLSTFYAQNDKKSIDKNGTIISLASLSLSIIYEILLIIFHSQLEHLLFMGKFSAYSYLIALWGIIPIIQSIDLKYTLTLRSIQKPQVMFIMSIYWAISSLLFGFILTKFFGILGATYSQIIGYAISTAVKVVYYHKWFSKATDINPSSANP